MNEKSRQAPLTIYSIGHSTRPLDEFIAILHANGIGRIVDIRAFPHSARNGQFNIETLPPSLQSAGVNYTHIPGLGGRRRPVPGSANTGWHNISFQGFADYMQTIEFEIAIQRLIALAASERISLMCAEAMPWRCHRSLIADALTARGIAVTHILGPGTRRPHALTPFARLMGGHLIYPAGTGTEQERRPRPRRHNLKRAVLRRRAKLEKPMIQIKRVYEKHSRSDGICYLVERLWPRGMKKESLKLNGGWLKEAAPSATLRRWFGHDPAKWAAFQRRYRAELDKHPEAWQPILEAARNASVTLYYSARDIEHNNARVLKEYLEDRLKH